ncbi:MAG: hypothetical protein COZ80_03350 [Ignavibacteria bacterium CG_4_8_14_3_um_filter_37_9]|nr:MAG: hypothetical protein COZ80_03350 [Ignavibacteria bacterium CG_4_8_14_3_um_filter_37_9]
MVPDKKVVLYYSSKMSRGKYEPINLKKLKSNFSCYNDKKTINLQEMNELFRNSAKRLIALLLLGFFIFSFLHSELGLLDHDNDNKACVDYCEIIKNANTHSNILKDELPKLELNKDICIHCFEEIKEQETQTSFEKTDQHLKAKPSTDLYLFNNTFLI